MKNSFGARGGIRKREGDNMQTWGRLEVAGTSKTRKGRVTRSRDANRPIRGNADAKNRREEPTGLLKGLENLRRTKTVPQADDVAVRC